MSSCAQRAPHLLQQALRALPLADVSHVFPGPEMKLIRYNEVCVYPIDVPAN